MKATKRFLSAIMAMAMVCGTAITVSAADGDEPTVQANEGGTGWSGNMSGTGSSEGNVGMEVFDIVLPTTTINYIVDAQGLIKQSTANGQAKRTAADKTTVVYSTKEATKEITDAKVTAPTDSTKPANYVKEDGFVFFPVTDTKGTKMANYLNITIENKSSFGVDVAPTLEYSTNGVDNPISGSTTAEGNIPASKGLAFKLYQKKEVKNDAGKVTGYEYVTPDDLSLGAASAAYETVWNKTDGKYEYSFNEKKYTAAKLTDNKRYFTLEGNAATDIEADKNPGNIKIVWNFAKTPDPDPEP
jgi:hypothetical protein